MGAYDFDEMHRAPRLSVFTTVQLISYAEELRARYNEQIEYTVSIERENRDLIVERDAAQALQRMTETSLRDAHARLESNPVPNPIETLIAERADLLKALNERRSDSIQVGTRDYNAGYRHGVRDATEGALRALLSTHKEQQA